MFTFQFKYRIEATEKLAATEGMYGERTALNATYNGLVNDQGAANTNKPGDLKVLFFIKPTLLFNT